MSQGMESGNLFNRSMEVVQVMENGNRYVTKEEFENLASRIEEYEEKRMFEKKVEEEKMLERFNELNDRIMIVDTKGKKNSVLTFFICLFISLLIIDFKTNLRMKHFEKQIKSLDTRCKELNDRFESVRPVTSNEVIFFEKLLSLRHQTFFKNIPWLRLCKMINLGNLILFR